jgi:DNA (cytosine-5)-methyltransferase 1
MKVLNLYAGIGGNRKLWKDCEVTAVELNPEVAEIYKSFFPDDKIIIGDAADYLAKHYDEFDFIWASPPCQSHSKLNQVNNRHQRYNKSRKLPDMILYAEIIYLQTFFRGNWVVENVKPYYKPLIQPSFEIARHYFWSNKIIWNLDFNMGAFTNIKDDVESMQKLYGFNLQNWKGKTTIGRWLKNCVIPEVGEYIFNKIRERE